MRKIFDKKGALLVEIMKVILRNGVIFISYYKTKEGKNLL